MWNSLRLDTYKTNQKWPHCRDNKIAGVCVGGGGGGGVACMTHNKIYRLTSPGNPTVTQGYCFIWSFHQSRKTKAVISQGTLCMSPVMSIASEILQVLLTTSRYVCGSFVSESTCTKMSHSEYETIGKSPFLWIMKSSHHSGKYIIAGTVYRQGDQLTGVDRVLILTKTPLLLKTQWSQRPSRWIGV